MTKNKKTQNDKWSEPLAREVSIFLSEFEADEGSIFCSEFMSRVL